MDHKIPIVPLPPEALRRPSKSRKTLGLPTSAWHLPEAFDGPRKGREPLGLPTSP